MPSIEQIVPGWKCRGPGDSNPSSELMPWPEKSLGLEDPVKGHKRPPTLGKRGPCHEKTQESKKNPGVLRHNDVGS